MTENSSPNNSPTTPKKTNKRTIGIVIAVVVIVIIAGVVVGVVLTKPKQSSTPLAISPSVSSVQTSVGTPLTFTTGVTTNMPFSKAVWNFGNGVEKTVTSNLGEISYTYTDPGSYLVTVTVYATNGSTLTNNQSLFGVTIIPPTVSNDAAIYGGITINLASGGTTNQTIPSGGFENLTFSGSLLLQPLTVGSSVPGALNYTISSFVWNIDSGSSIIKDNNTGLPETINVTFSSPGIHTVDLITNTTSGTSTATGDYILTIAAGNYSISSKPIPVSIDKNQLVNAIFFSGGPTTFDPAINYDLLGYEVLNNVYQGLVYYNGSSTSQFNPVIATNVPTVANGEVNANHTVWTFYVNTSIKFSNGDPVTPYDVYQSIARTLLFSNDPGCPGWITAHIMLPGPSIYGPFNTSFYWIHRAITWNNTTNSVTFHLMPANATWLPNATATYGGQSYGNLNQTYQIEDYGGGQYFLQIMALIYNFVLDNSWLNDHGAGLANTSAAYQNYIQDGNESHWVQYLHYNTMGTGPYEESLYEPAQETILTVNPYYQQTPGNPAPSKLIPKIILEYESNDATSVSQLASGYAQVGMNAFPPSETQQALNLEKQGILKSFSFSELAAYTWVYNLNLNVSGAKLLDGQTNIDQFFFANLSVRKAFSYAYNYTYAINDANSFNGIPFVSALTGLIPNGMPNYPSNLSAEFNQNQSISLARYYWNQTNYSKTGKTYYLPIVSQQGNPQFDAEVTVWIAALQAMSGGHVQPELVDLSSNDISSLSSAPSMNPIPITVQEWFFDYPDPSDFVGPFYQEYGIFSYPDGLMQEPGFNQTTNPSQWANITEMWNLFDKANGQTNYTERTIQYWKAERIALNLYLYVGTVQPLEVLYYSPYIVKATLDPSMLTPGTLVYYYIQYT